MHRCPKCHLEYPRENIHMESECRAIRLAVQVLIDKGVTWEIYRNWCEATKGGQ